MKISYNWLKQYLSIDNTPEELDKILTDIGLEVEGVEKRQSIKGGLEGLVIGKVVEKEKHPNADKLSVTKVDVGAEEPLPIVCGAPNVDANQKVVVATVGTTLYDGEGSFQIKKSKIRGEVSMGMICAEDEIGLGQGHDGIMVLEETAEIGARAADYFNIETDYIFEIGLTPNRADAMSHIGVARDLKAYFNVHGASHELQLPDLSSFPELKEELPVSIEIKNKEACPRYAGLYIKNVKVQESPDWLKKNLESIGLTPKNNIVDITNFVLHEFGQPLHAFDADEIKGGKVLVQNLEKGSQFKTLDGEERILHQDDLMICDANQGMCIAGVFGGEQSGVKETTKNVFLESAYFNPVAVRKASKRHALKTDASFRFERGVDPEAIIDAMKRAALLIQELAGAEVASKIEDQYAEAIAPFEVTFDHQKNNGLLGEEIPEDFVIKLFKELEIDIKENKDGVMTLSIPSYRVDVQRQADLSEEILRMYGYNTIAIPTEIKSALVTSEFINPEKIRKIAFDHLASVGFNEIMNNSLSNPKLYADKTAEENMVKMLNPLSQELEVMRPEMLIDGLKTIAYNVNRQTSEIKIFESGRIYTKREDKYIEDEKVAIWVSGKRNKENWMNNNEAVSFYYLKGIVENLLARLGLSTLKYKAVENPFFSDSLEIKVKKKSVVILGKVAKTELKKADLDQETYYAELNWENIFNLVKQNNITYKAVSKYPSVRRDLSLLVDKETNFLELESLAKQAENQLLKEIGLFDVYEGDKLPEGKKSYAMYFVLQNEEKTMNDKVIDKIMSKIQKTYETKLNAQLR